MWSQMLSVCVCDRFIEIHVDWRLSEYFEWIHIVSDDSDKDNDDAVDVDDSNRIHNFPKFEKVYEKWSVLTWFHGYNHSLETIHKIFTRKCFFFSFIPRYELYLFIYLVGLVNILESKFRSHYIRVCHSYTHSLLSEYVQMIESSRLTLADLSPYLSLSLSIDSYVPTTAC